jgi:nucleoside phosphorylase
MIGIVIATVREAAPLLTALGATAGDDTPPPCHWRFELAGEELIVLIGGMGQAPAAAATTRAIVDFGATEIINIGIAGAVSDQPVVGALYRIENARCLPDDGKRLWTCTAGRWPDLPQANISTVGAPVYDADQRAELAKWGELVDMEGAMVAKIAARHTIPCTLLKGISDRAGDGDRTTLFKNIDEVSKKLAQVVLAALPI